MRKLWDSDSVNIAPGFYFLLALMVMILPLGWCAAAAAAALFHELCHLTALRLCGGRVTDLQISPGGAVINAQPLPPGKALLCSLAGPAGSFLLLFTIRLFPRLAICAAMQGIYNLLPLTGLDGGHALRAAAMLLFSETAAQRICHFTERMVLSALLLLGIYGSFIRDLGLLPILMAMILCMKALGRKIPCKSPELRVQ